MSIRNVPGFKWVLISLFFAVKVSGQFVFKGKVVSGAGKMPLQGVSIAINKYTVGATDSNGVFEINSPKEKSVVSFSYSGYRAVSVSYSATQNDVISLEPSDSLLSEITVKAFETNAVLKNVPVTVSVLGRTDLERYSNASILPAVNTVPGVKMDERSP